MEMVVLDELHFPSQETLTDAIGGSGAYSKTIFTSVTLNR